MSYKHPYEDRILEHARECILTPWHHQGRLLGVGIDCIGLLVHTAKVSGFQYKDSKDYGRIPTPTSLLKGLKYSGLTEVEPDSRNPGDVFAFVIKRYPQHVGIFSGSSLIHTWETVGRCVEHTWDERWERRIHSVWRFPEWLLSPSE